MGIAVKKTISLPPELAKEVEELARAEGKTLSAVIQDALRAARAARLKGEFRSIQGYWSRKAKEKGILTERELDATSVSESHRAMLELGEYHGVRIMIFAGILAAYPTRGWGKTFLVTEVHIHRR